MIAFSNGGNPTDLGKSELSFWRHLPDAPISIITDRVYTPSLERASQAEHFESVLGSFCARTNLRFFQQRAQYSWKKIQEQLKFREDNLNRMIEKAMMEDDRRNGR